MYKELWCSRYITGIKTALVTISSALGYGSDENIFSLTFFLFWIILHIQSSVHIQGFNLWCVLRGGGLGSWGASLSASWSPSCSGFCGMIFH